MDSEIQDQLTASSLMNAAEYMVCGVVVSSSLTAEEYARLEDYENEKDLTGLRVRLERASAKFNKDSRENVAPEYRIQTEKIEKLEVARKAKLEQLEKDPLGWDDEVDDDYLNRLERKIAAAYLQLEALQPDPALILASTTKAQKELTELQREFQVFHFEYVHGLATSRKLTKEKLETWIKRAEPQDYANSRAVVAKGKSLRNLSAVAKPHFQTTASLKN